MIDEKYVAEHFHLAFDAEPSLGAAQRLRSTLLEAGDTRPRQGRTMPRVHSRSIWRPTRLPALAVAAIMLLLIVNVGLVYFIPVYGSALARAPFVGSVSTPVLKYIGLDPGAINGVDDVAVANGHKLHLIGAYADPLRTLTLIEIDDQPLAVPSKTSHTYDLDATLSDQFGRQYNRVYSPGATEFEPLQPPAATIGARLTLHVTELLPTFRDGSIVSGSWDLHFVITQAPGKALPLPASVIRGDTTYTFTSAQLSGQLLKLRWLVSGGANHRAHARIAAGSFADPASSQVELWPVLVLDSGGQLVQMRTYGYTFPNGRPAEGQWEGVLPGPGRYTIGIGSGDAKVTSTIAVT
ncbi:hypothetical protein EPN29_05830 [bacterium]|nr:MAG: hypothetical protein EPN29_05830 [bacterium]